MTADDGRFEADRTSPIQKHGPGNRAIFIPETMIPLRQATPAHAKPGSLPNYPSTSLPLLKRGIRDGGALPPVFIKNMQAKTSSIDNPSRQRQLKSEIFPMHSTAFKPISSALKSSPFSILPPHPQTNRTGVIHSQISEEDKFQTIH
ncbi:hypothetical protein ACPRNU_22940 [Chromobacterium vaccinii]|uniref:hypothetical protein n=1 Tax=Chromobacterium vaccinii TaxID=1108595 RepID=UPI003C7520DB